MNSQKKDWLTTMMKKRVSTFTGSLLLFSALVFSLDSMPEPTNENETVFLKLLSTNLQKIEDKTPEKKLNNFRIKVLTQKLKKQEKENEETKLLIKKLFKGYEKNKFKF